MSSPFVNNGTPPPRLVLTRANHVRHGNIAASAVVQRKYTPEEIKYGVPEYNKFLQTKEGREREQRRKEIMNKDRANGKNVYVPLLGNRGGKSTKRTRKHKSKRHSRRK
jgi:hypothetical protein